MLLVLLMLSFSLCSCIPEFIKNNDDDDDDDYNSHTSTAKGTETSDTSETPDAPYELVMLENGSFNFRIIRPEFEASEIVKSAADLRTKLAELTGAGVQIGDDYVSKNEVRDPDKYEILFGRTNYTESTELYRDINYGTYRISIKGNKVVFAVTDSISAQRAVDVFIGYFKAQMSGGKAVISSEYRAEAVVNTVTGRAPVYTDGVFQSYSIGGAGEYTYVYEKTSAEAFNNYITSSTAEGKCSLYASCELGDNLSATLTNDKTIVNAFYTAAESKARIIIEPSSKTSLPCTEEQNKYTKVCDSSLTQLGLEQPYNGGALFTDAVKGFQIGMCYIFRLADSSFILIDGGFNRSECADMIYNKLVNLAYDKNNIVIAAWIFTHQHGDHVGAYKQFTSKYSGRVRLETLIYNFATDAELASVNENSTYPDAVSASLQKFSGSKCVIAHPGQVHYLRNAKLEVLHTIDLMRPRATYNGGNSFSMTVKITLEGQTYMFSGDSYNDSTDVICQNYGKYLKSDFCQLIHHGAPGGSNQYYQLVDPTIVLWPLGTYDYYPWRRYEEYHQYIFRSTNVKEIILSGYTNRTISLPYEYPSQKTLPEEIPVTWQNVNAK